MTSFSTSHGTGAATQQPLPFGFARRCLFLTHRLIFRVPHLSRQNSSYPSLASDVRCPRPLALETEARFRHRDHHESKRLEMAAPVAARRQSTRQVRSSAARPLNYYARTFDRGAGNAGGAGSRANAQPGFFPAITHFTDAVDALPQEMIRHFSMLKEVEAKVHQPDEELRRLSDFIARLPPSHKTHIPTQEGHFPGLSAQNSVRASRNGSVHSSFTPMQLQSAVGASTADQTSPSDAQSEAERQQLYRQLNYTIMHMAPMLDEKMAVLSTANQILRKQLDRLESSYRFVGDELSDEARFGSMRHWAFVTEKETKKPPERARRENAGTNNYAAGVDDFASVRSEARREAMHARKARRQQLDSDFDDAPAPKKGPKGRKPAVEATDGRSVGLGILNGASGPGKKRKAPGAATMERSMSAAMRGTLNQSPLETPPVEPIKKRAKTAPGPAPKKRYFSSSDVATEGVANTHSRNLAAGNASPRLASSPITGTFAQREVGSRPTTARARQNSTANIAMVTAEPIKNRPTSSASNRPMNITPVQPELPVNIVVAPVPVIKEASPKEVVEMIVDKPAEVPERKAEEQKPEIHMDELEIPAPPVVTTRAGRASKPATPLISTFPEIAPPRGRNTRNKDTASGSHASSESGYGERPTRKKRGNGATTPSLLVEMTARKSLKTEAEEEQDSAVPDDDRSENPEATADGDDDGDDGMDADENEPRYCYCNGVSYGEMVACDKDDCPREWFHLKCAGLKEAPGEDCELTLNDHGTSQY